MQLVAGVTKEPATAPVVFEEFKVDRPLRSACDYFKKFGLKWHTSTYQRLIMKSYRLIFFSILFYLESLVCGQVIKAQCSACKAVAEILQERIDSEKPQNDLDFRGRLDSQGNRYGKVVQYKTSELRVHNLLDNICSVTADSFVLGKVNSTTQPGKQMWRWDRYKTKDGNINLQGSFQLGGAEHTSNKNLMNNYCGRLLEKHEDDISSIIQKGEIDNGGLEAKVCIDIAKVCRAAPRPTPEQIAEQEEARRQYEAAQKIKQEQEQVDKAFVAESKEGSGKDEGNQGEELKEEL